MRSTTTASRCCRALLASRRRPPAPRARPSPTRPATPPADPARFRQRATRPAAKRLSIVQLSPALSRKKLHDLADHPARSIVELSPGESQDPPAGGYQRVLPGPVVLEP